MSVKAMTWVWAWPLKPPGLKLVALALADHADHDGVCWPKVKRIARVTNLPKRQVQVYVRALVDEGLLLRQKEKTELGDWDSNIYRLLLDRTPPDEPEDAEGGDVVHNTTPRRRRHGGDVVHNTTPHAVHNTTRDVVDNVTPPPALNRLTPVNPVATGPELRTVKRNRHPGTGGDVAPSAPAARPRVNGKYGHVVERIRRRSPELVIFGTAARNAKAVNESDAASADVADAYVDFHEGRWQRPFVAKLGGQLYAVVEDLGAWRAWVNAQPLVNGAVAEREWDRALPRLQQALAADEFAAVVAPLRAVGYRGPELELEAPSAELAHRVSERLRRIEDELEAAAGRFVPVAVVAAEG